MPSLEGQALKGHYRIKELLGGGGKRKKESVAVFGCSVVCRPQGQIEASERWDGSGQEKETGGPTDDGPAPR